MEQKESLSKRWDDEKKIISTIEKIDSIIVENEKKVLGKPNQTVLSAYFSKPLKSRRVERIKSLKVKHEAACKSLQDLRDSAVKQSIEPRDEVLEDDIKDVITRWVGVPVGISASDKLSLMSLEEDLHKEIIGQEYAVKEVASAIKRFRTGMSEAERPIASFMFMGPPGVGKTQLAKAVANWLFKSKESFIRFDMSEYTSEGSITRLIGSPPGLIGYEKGGQLTELVRRKPYSVVLFDEIEKAHQGVHHIFLQILSAARLTDSHGMVVDFSNTIIIMTSNIGSTLILDAVAAGKPYGTIKKMALKAVAEEFSPEFINRFDNFIVFHPLDRAEIREIVIMQLVELNKKYQEINKFSIDVSYAAVEFLTEIAYEERSGARPVPRAIMEYIKNVISDGIVNETYKEKDIIFIDDTGVTFDNEPKLTFTKKGRSSEIEKVEQ